MNTWLSINFTQTCWLLRKLQWRGPFLEIYVSLLLSEGGSFAQPHPEFVWPILFTFSSSPPPCISPFCEANKKFPCRTTSIFSNLTSTSTAAAARLRRRYRCQNLIAKHFEFRWIKMVNVIYIIAAATRNSRNRVDKSGQRTLFFFEFGSILLVFEHKESQQQNTKSCAYVISQTVSDFFLLARVASKFAELTLKFIQMKVKATK